MPSQFLPNESFDRIFLLKQIDERRTKTGKPYLTLVLGTSEGSWDGRVWDMTMDSLPGLLEGDPVHVKGSAQLYQENIQLIVDAISKVENPVDPRSLYPSASASESELRTRFQDIVKGIEDPDLGALVDAMMKDRAISDAYFTSPAAISMHHARIGGLAEHSLNVCIFAHASLKAAPWLNRDLLTVGALLHDIGKVLEYEVAGDFRYTLEGKFLGHIIQGHNLVEKWIAKIPDFPERLALDVLHILLSHHGQLEFGSPRTPVTAEALVIHYADDLDAKLDMVRSAGVEPGTEEAFVRGLRRSFQYRKEILPEGERGRSTFAKATADKEGEGEKMPESVRRHGEGTTEEIPETETRRYGDTGGTEIREKENRRNGETKKTGMDSLRNGSTESRTHGSTDKSGGQEELF